MSLGPHVPEWQNLQDALYDLVALTGAAFAVVLDESHCVWCATSISKDALDSIVDLYEREVENHVGTPLRRGRHLSVLREAEPPRDAYLAESFGGIYILGLWFKKRFNPTSANESVRLLLPVIADLTFALPPPDGPYAGSAAAKMRA